MAISKIAAAAFFGCMACIFSPFVLAGGNLRIHQAHFESELGGHLRKFQLYPLAMRYPETRSLIQELAGDVRNGGAKALVSGMAGDAAWDLVLAPDLQSYLNDPNGRQEITDYIGKRNTQVLEDVAGSSIHMFLRQAYIYQANVSGGHNGAAPVGKVLSGLKTAFDGSLNDSGQDFPSIVKPEFVH